MIVEIAHSAARLERSSFLRNEVKQKKAGVLRQSQYKFQTEMSAIKKSI